MEQLQSHDDSLNLFRCDPREALTRLWASEMDRRAYIDLLLTSGYLIEYPI